MTWLRTGTVSVTAGSTAVVGAGTGFSGADADDVFFGPDGRPYQLGAVEDNTHLTLTTPYLGATGSGQTYAILKLYLSTAGLTARMEALATLYKAAADLALAGRFGDGSAAAPGIAFANDQDNGLYRIGQNHYALSVAGQKVLEIQAGKVTFWATLEPQDIVKAAAYEYVSYIRNTEPSGISAFGLKNSAGTVVGGMGYYGAGDLLLMSINTPAGAARLQSAGGAFDVMSDGTFAPTLDNLLRVGSSARRVAQLVAGTAVISTSDAREKEWRGPLSPAELAVAIGVADLIGAYRWIEAIETKGAAARVHFGVRAQDVVSLFADHGLDAFCYGVVCYDKWIGDDGVERDRYGVRESELWAMVVAAFRHGQIQQDARLSAMESRIAALEPQSD
ncbi:hypothetical protein N825_25480 [Skermanella stibiiresistens SB22]|uniref:Peptidase S74 domain-containing protein n=1 Tax=Skermanella stibiiresistens SB22 TaxID=1385369 RepID=W9GSQ8_9PROT|nr:tail fiber domain-containing protein [Skermanella stibiiresistens]EWY36789.1 hypothetical protein N825_25480 [Skermanella stibiiresistens SB22]